MAKSKEVIKTVVWTRERLLSDALLVSFVACIGVTMFLAIRTYLTPLALL